MSAVGPHNPVRHSYHIFYTLIVDKHTDSSGETLLTFGLISVLYSMQKTSKDDLVEDGLLNVRDAGAFLGGLSRSAVYNLMATGELAYVKIGRARRIPKRALIELAAANLRKGLLSEWRPSQDE